MNRLFTQGLLWWRELKWLLTKPAQPKETLSQTSLDQDQLPSQLVTDFVYASKNFFEERGGNFYIGGELVQENLLEVLRGQAKFLKNSQLLEMIDATNKNEVGNLALKATSLEHLQYLKALHHWNYVMQNIIHALAKN